MPVSLKDLMMRIEIVRDLHTILLNNAQKGSLPIQLMQTQEKLIWQNVNV